MVQRRLVRDVPAAAVDQARLDQLGDRVDQTGAAQALCLDVADHLAGDVVVAHLDHLDGAVGRAHAALDRPALEGRTGGCGGRQDALAVAEHDLAVGADVDEETKPLVPVHPRGQHPGHDVAADVRAECGQQHRAGPRMHGDAEVAGQQLGEDGGRHHERRDAERLGVDAEREGAHRRVAGQGDLVDLQGVDAGLGAHLGGELRQRVVRELGEPAERIRVEHGGADPGDDVAAEGLLLVEHRGDRRRGAGRRVEQRGDHRRGARGRRRSRSAAPSCHRARHR